MVVRRLLGDDEVVEHPAQGRGLHRVRVGGQEVIAEGALLLVTDQVGLQNLLAALRARHHEGHGRRVAWQERAGERSGSCNPETAPTTPSHHRGGENALE